MGKSIVVTINKGGAGKTTTATNLAFELAKSKKICLLDLDPQCGVSITVGKSPNNFANKSILSVVNNKYDLNKVINNYSDNLDIIYCEPNFKFYDALISENNNINHNLNKVIQFLKKNYDYVVIDTPSNLSITTMVAMSSANIVVIPFECERQNLEGVFNTLNELSDKKYNQKIIKFLIPLKFKSRSLIDNELLNYLNERIELDNKWSNVIISDIIIPFSSQYKNIVARYKKPLVDAPSKAKYILIQKELIYNITNRVIKLTN